jgi:fused signal recognition particle receptor
MSFFAKLKAGLSKSSEKLTTGIVGLITKRRLDDDVLEELEELLVSADVGVTSSSKIVAAFGKERFGKEVSEQEIKEFFAGSIASILDPYAKKLEPDFSNSPVVIMAVGVNGNGKTTTLGKLASQYKAEGKSVMLAACDTFRAAAVEQLQEWGRRSGCEVVTGEQNSDPASVAFRALEQAKTSGYDILLIDTAGRLQNKTGLMEELAKIKRVLGKVDESAPHYTLLVLDATTGQNAHSQAEAFKEIVNISGIIVTKLDGTAKGGVVVALAEKFSLPIYAIGVGEGIDDLRPFDAKEFANSLMGL